MIAAGVPQPRSGPLYWAEFAVASRGNVGMFNAAQQIRSAIDDQPHEGVFEQKGGLVGGYAGAKRGATADLFMGWGSLTQATKFGESAKDSFEVFSAIKSVGDSGCDQK